MDPKLSHALGVVLLILAGTATGCSRAFPSYAALYLSLAAILGSASASVLAVAPSIAPGSPAKQLAVAQARMLRSSATEAEKKP